MEDGRLRPFWRFSISVLVFFAANFVASSLAALIGGQDTKLVQAVFRPALMAALLLGYGGMLRAFDGVASHRLAAMGLPGGWRALRHALAGIGVGAVMAIITVAVIASAADLKVEAKPIQHAASLFVIEVFVVLSTAAMAEEVAFRGYPFQRLIEVTGRGGAIAAFSAAFGAVHLKNPHATTIGFLNTVLIGVVFAIAYLRARTLWLPWGMHWAWNFLLGAVIGLPVSGVDMSIGFRTRALGPVWITGGAYGPEASPACTIAVAVALVVVLVAFRGSKIPLNKPADVTSAGGIQSM
ncbi:MAG: CPBP family intramembrane metalloprotease [Acidobacteriia bacterium]|nr:CPBP family intramembrane metalloprotease [Terriglobia bacterium]